MEKRLLYLVPLCLVLAGCASTKRIHTLESRVAVLENKLAPAEREQVSMESQALMTSAPEKTAPETPSKKDIQTALKNAGYYTGDIDGKIGKKTKSAIEEFQSANGLKTDGKVGPKTWDKLKVYWR